MRTRVAYAFFGVLATLVGMATGHLVASLLNPASSPVLAVGSQVIDLTPTSLKEWAISHFGSNDKKVLIGNVLAGVLVLAAVAGLLALRRFVYGAVLLVVLVAVAAFTALNRPAAELLDVVPSLATAVAGVAALYLLDRRSRAARTGPADPGPTTSGTGTDVIGSGSAGPLDQPIHHPIRQPSRQPSRRGVLVTAGVLTAAAAVMGGAGRWIGTYRSRLSDIALPKPASPAGAFPAGLDKQVPGITPFRVSRGDFYRVDTRLDVPIVDQDSWSLTIDGMVDKELSFSFDDLLAMPLIERDITLTCVSNSVGGPYVGGARWLGVPLKTLLDQAGVDPKADQIFSTDVDGMTIGTPTALALDGRDAMIAVGMNGEILPREHGFPARIIVPGLYGFISATKWVTKITMTTYADMDSYWTKRKWDTNAPIKISSRIDTPKVLTTIPKGNTFIGGVAWAQENGGVSKVQVQIDGGAWTDAMLGPTAGNDYWRQWFLPWNADSGSHTLACRCIDGKGQTQTAARAEPFPGGSSGVQSLLVTVA